MTHTRVYILLMTNSLGVLCTTAEYFGNIHRFVKTRLLSIRGCSSICPHISSVLFTFPNLALVPALPDAKQKCTRRTQGWLKHWAHSCLQSSLASLNCLQVDKSNTLRPLIYTSEKNMNCGNSPASKHNVAPFTFGHLQQEHNAHHIQTTRQMHKSSSWKFVWQTAAAHQQSRASGNQAAQL